MSSLTSNVALVLLSQVTLIPGDGIGPELADSVKEIFTALNVPVEFDQYNVSGETGGDEKVFKAAMDSLKRNKVGLKGKQAQPRPLPASAAPASYIACPAHTPWPFSSLLVGILSTTMGPGEHNSWNIAMRQSLDIYASVVVCKSLPGLKTRHDNVDFAIIRENTEGEYSGLEHQSYPGVVESLKVSTRKGSERIARFAFDFALKNGRKVRTHASLTPGDSLPRSKGVFRSTASSVRSEGV